MLKLSFWALGSLLLLLWAGFLGRYWDRNVPSGAEGGWRRKFAVRTSVIWRSMGRDLWPMVVIYVAFTFVPIVLCLMFE